MAPILYSTAVTTFSPHVLEGFLISLHACISTTLINICIVASMHQTYTKAYLKSYAKNVHVFNQKRPDYTMGYPIYGTSHKISHGAQFVPQKAHRTSSVNGGLLLGLTEYHGIFHGMSHGIFQPCKRALILTWQFLLCLLSLGLRRHQFVFARHGCHNYSYNSCRGH
jgi:hypothetical protein